LDLLNKSDVMDFFTQHKPDIVIDAAAKVGGIYANSTQPVDFLIDNLTIQNNLMTAAHQIDCSKFIFLSSSCVYPKLAVQPIKESYLLSGELEKTNDTQAIAIANDLACDVDCSSAAGHQAALAPTGETSQKVLRLGDVFSGYHAAAPGHSLASPLNVQNECVPPNSRMTVIAVWRLRRRASIVNEYRAVPVALAIRSSSSAG
jgi:hypothetical protein